MSLLLQDVYRQGTTCLLKLGRRLSIVFMIRRAGKREALRGERADRLA